MSLLFILAALDLSMEEEPTPKITTVKYEYGQNDKPVAPQKQTAIAGGITDSRFEPSLWDNIQLKAQAALIVAHYVPQFVQLTFGFLTMNWKTIITSLTAIIVSVVVAKWPFLQTIDIGGMTLSSIVSTGLIFIAGLIVPNEISKWKKEHPDESLDK